MKNKAVPKGKELASNEIVDFMEEQSALENSRARNLDDLAIYDEMTIGLIAAVKKDLAAGLTAEQMLDKYANLAAASIVNIAATEADSGKRLAAAKDILDRVKGKAIERKQVHHKLEGVDEKQLDAIILSELEQLSISDDEESED